MKTFRSVLPMLWVCASLTVHAERPPHIVTHPASQTGIANEPVTLSVQAEGTPPFAYQWYRNYKALDGATDREITVIAPPADRTIDHYQVTVTNALGFDGSRVAYLGGYLSGPYLPGRYTFSSDGFETPFQGKAGVDASLTALSVGQKPETMQWYQDGQPIPGANGPTLYLENPQPTSQPVTFSVRATNALGSNELVRVPVTFSRNLSRPVFYDSPRQHTVTLGADAELRVNARGEDLAYQWSHDNVVVAGATSPTLSFSAVTLEQCGIYTCLVSNPHGESRTGFYFLSVKDPPRLSNLSIRARTGSDAGTLIVGFVVGNAPSGAAPFFLARAAGPALRAYGVSEAVSDPLIHVYRGNSLISENDDWGGGTWFSDQARAVGAFPFTDPASRDAALLTSFASGAYTLQIQSKDGGAGIVLTEIYETVLPSASHSSLPRLSNVSARATVGTGEDILIAGFAVAGHGARRVLIRGAGPALEAFGVSGALANPVLELYQGSTLIAANDNWSGDTALTNAAQTAGAFAWTNPQSKDAALIAALEPGAYSVQIRGAGETTGVALVELYELP